MLDVGCAKAPNFTCFTRKGRRFEKEELQKEISVFAEVPKELSS